MNQQDIAIAIAAPFTDHEVKRRPGRGGQQFRYVDARTVGARLTEVLGIAGWDFQSTVVDPERHVVHGRLTARIDGQVIVREDVGYPNGDRDEEPLKSAVSDALKRTAVHIGVGAYLYQDETITKDRAVVAEAAEVFTAAIDAIRAINQTEAQRIEAGLQKLGARDGRLSGITPAQAAWARDRAIAIMDKVIAEANAEDLA